MPHFLFSKGWINCISGSQRQGEIYSRQVEGGQGGGDTGIRGAGVRGRGKRGRGTGKERGGRRG